MDLKGRIVLVSGGAHRVGKAIALHLASLGPKAVVFTYNSSARAAVETQNAINNLGIEAFALQCDQADVSQIRSVFNHVEKKYERLDVLVNSASVFLTADFLSVTPETWDRVMDVNARGPMFFMQFAVPLMQKSGGCMINIIDESVKKPALSWIHHGAAKAALWNLTKSAAIALAPEIRVNAVLPGAVLKPAEWSDERWEQNRNSIPLKKLGSVEDVCEAVEFIIKAEFMTGQAIVIDGGSTVL